MNGGNHDTVNIVDTVDTPRDIEAALGHARALARAGIPVFVAHPCPGGCMIPGHTGGPGQYHPPTRWERTVADPMVVDTWRPGDALAAVGGVMADFLDIDPRNGGSVSLREIRAAGHMPRHFARATTPSGGEHYLISPTGERKGVLAKGIDLQAGAPNGQGHGFVWIAPTVRASQAEETLGQMRTYRWVEPPDTESLDELAEYARSGDDSLTGIRTRMLAKRAGTNGAATGAGGVDGTAPGAPWTPPAPPVNPDPDDPFVTATDVTRASRGAGAHDPTDRRFTFTQAREFVRGSLVSLAGAQVGEIEETANRAACLLSHFVPAFWSVDEAYELLTGALSRTAYDPHRPGTNWTAEKFVDVLSGKRPVSDPWKAVRVGEPSAEITTGIAGETAGESSVESAQSTLEKLRGMLLSAEELAAAEPPEPLVHGLLNLDSESWMIGAPGSRKTFVALRIAMNVGRGEPLWGHPVKQGNVLYLAAEGQRGMVLRVRALTREYGEMRNVTFLPYPVRVKSADGQWPALVELARELHPALVVVDTQHRVSVGLEENSATDMGLVIDAVGALRRATGACVLVIHHTGRSGDNARGSSAIDGAQDTELRVVCEEPREGLTCRLVTDKQKDMAEGDERGERIRLHVVDLGIDPRTGLPLSSLVVEPDPADVFETAQEDGLDMRRGERPWLPMFDSRGKWAKLLLSAIYDFAVPGVGATKSELKGVLVRDAGLSVKSSHFEAAWTTVLAARDTAGDPVVGEMRAGRYDITSVPALQGMTTRFGERGGGAGGGGALRALLSGDATDAGQGGEAGGGTPEDV